MGLLLDIVPNHMAVSEENPWWMDVLENGQESEFASYFDIDWSADPLQRSRILLPVLGDAYGKVLENQGLALHYDDHGFFVRYYQMRFPIRPETYRQILGVCLEEMEENGAPVNGIRRTLKALCEISGELAARSAGPPEEEPPRNSQVSKLKNELWELYREPGTLPESLDQTLSLFNGLKGVRRSFDRLDRLLSSQAYRLAYWRQASQEINYRRFFDINELVGIRIENPKVFEARHASIFRLMKKAPSSALRIDHIDGLRDPLRLLVKALPTNRGNRRSPRNGRPEPYVVVEKIVGGAESLPPEWPVAGTTGYDFINAANLVLVEPAGYSYLERLYRDLLAMRTLLQRHGISAKNRPSKSCLAARCARYPAGLRGWR